MLGTPAAYGAESRGLLVYRVLKLFSDADGGTTGRACTAAPAIPAERAHHITISHTKAVMDKLCLIGVNASPIGMPGKHRRSTACST